MINKNNVFLNSELSENERNKIKAKFHILPVPLEKTVSSGTGTSRGPEAILSASNELERYTGKSEPCLDGIYTYPIMDCDKPINQVIENIRKITKEISSNNKIAIIIVQDTITSLLIPSDDRKDKSKRS
jgi:agmatinase